jgi:hypothetical protein
LAVAAEVRPFAVDAAGARALHDPPVRTRNPRADAARKAAPDPARHSPDPIPGDHRIVEQVITGLIELTQS